MYGCIINRDEKCRKISQVREDDDAFLYYKCNFKCLCDDQVTVLSRSLAGKSWRRVCTGEEHLRVIIQGKNWESQRDYCVPRAWWEDKTLQWQKD